MDLREGTWPADWPSDAFVALEQTGRRITLQPNSARVELRRLHERLPVVLDWLAAMKGDSTLIQRAPTHLAGDRSASRRP